MKYTHSLSNKNNNTEIINHFFNNININNTNISTNNNYHSSLDNKNNINNKIILSFDLKKNSLINSQDKLLIIKPNNILFNKILFGFIISNLFGLFIKEFFFKSKDNIILLLMLLYLLSKEE